MLIYRFGMQGALRDHALEAIVHVTPGVPGGREQQEELPQLELMEVYMERGARRRRIRGKLSTEIEDHLVEHTQEILEQFRREASC